MLASSDRDRVAIAIAIVLTPPTYFIHNNFAHGKRPVHRVSTQGGESYRRAPMGAYLGYYCIHNLVGAS